MQEIWCRGWHEGYSDKQPITPAQMLHDERPGDCLNWRNQGQPIKAVMLWTGLNCRASGERIYVGDIVFQLDGIMGVVLLSGVREGGVHGYFVHYGRVEGEMDLLATSSYPWATPLVAGGERGAEVLGNVFENPELLSFVEKVGLGPEAQKIAALSGSKNKASKAEEPPYLLTVQATVSQEYNPNYGDDRMCECGHPYYRHFDSYEDMRAAGCKYCGCWEFKEKAAGREGAHDG